MNPAPEQLAAIAARACRDAAATIRAAADEPLRVADKYRYAPVSDADVRAETQLRAALTGAVPGSGVVGEELPEAAGTGVYWYVDPIDGTANFIRGLPLAAISVGAAVDGTLVAGCVYDLYRDECFTGGPGLPLTVTAPYRMPAAPGAGEPVVVSDVPLPGRVTPQQVQFVGELMQRATLRRIYSTALALAWVAAGRADAACNLGVSPWDVAGGAALAASAGVTYTPIGGDTPLTAPGFVAAGPAHAELGAWLTARLRTLHQTL